MTFLDQVFALLAQDTHRDLAPYKPDAILLGVERRMGVHRMSCPDAYIALLYSDPSERVRLLGKLTVGATAFFRDPPAWRALACLALPSLLVARPGPCRAWVAGCSTGEEAYSLAMLLEEAHPHGSPEHGELVELLATDLDEQALQRARAGLYPARIEEDLEPERLARFFTPCEGGYRIAPRLGERVRFARHDLLEDLHPGPVDLILCRNLLIYLQPAWQARLLEILHGALNPGGLLLLGMAEDLEDAWRHFSPVDRSARLFRKSAP